MNDLHEQLDRLRYRLELCEEDEECEAIEQEIAELERAVNPGQRRGRRTSKRRGSRNPEELLLYVALVDGGGTQGVYPISAELVGKHLLVHPSLRDPVEVLAAVTPGSTPQSYAITHVPTGQLVATVATDEWAKKLAKEINSFAGPGIASADVFEVQDAIGGPMLEGAEYITYSALSSFEGGPFETLRRWRYLNTELGRAMAHNPEAKEDRKARAAVSAAVGSLLGGLIGVVVGAVGGGALGLVGGALLGGPEGAVGGLMVGAVFGIPLGLFIGTIWGAVRQTDRALHGVDASTAKVAAGVGSVFLGPIGAGLGAYLGA